MEICVRRRREVMICVCACVSHSQQYHVNALQCKSVHVTDIHNFRHGPHCFHSLIMDHAVQQTHLFLNLDGKMRCAFYDAELTLPSERPVQMDWRFQSDLCLQSQATQFSSVPHDVTSEPEPLQNVDFSTPQATPQTCYVSHNMQGTVKYSDNLVGPPSGQLICLFACLPAC